jgi:hypothetical protein
MANPTTNYGFVLPTSTDLVTDLPADFDVALQGVDTRLKALQPGTTLGDIAYSSATANTNTRLAVGSSGNVLTVAGGVPTWAAPVAGGGMTLIQETVASAASAIDFSTISGSYKQLLLVWTGIQHSASGSAFPIRFNSDSGSNYKNLSNSSTDVSVGGAFLTSNTSIISANSTDYSPFGTSANDAGLPNHATGSLLIDNYASSTKLKFYTGTWSFWNGTNVRFVLNLNGVYDSTTAISSINIFRASGAATLTNAANTSIRLYGIS